MSSSSSKSKIPSEERNSSSSSSKNHHGHHKKDKKEKHKESDKKENQQDKSKKSSSHHKSHKSSSSSKDKQAAEVSSNGLSGSNIEIPTDINPNYKPPKVRQSYSLQQPLQPLSANTNPHIRNGNGQKTLAFSQYEKIPSLIQLCVHVLQDNVSMINECGNLPYEVLKPILERGKPEDIVRIEDYNPRLMVDTGELWEQIVKRCFPRADRQEFESYREMYERQVQEREEKYEKLTGKFATSYASLKTNNRQTKLTYIDSAPKVPRGAKQTQEKMLRLVEMKRAKWIRSAWK